MHGWRGPALGKASQAPPVEPCRRASGARAERGALGSGGGGALAWKGRDACHVDPWTARSSWPPSLLPLSADTKLTKPVCTCLFQLISSLTGPELFTPTADRAPPGVNAADLAAYPATRSDSGRPPEHAHSTRGAPAAPPQGVILGAEGGMPTRLYGSLAVSYAHTLHSRRYPARLATERDSQGRVGPTL